MQSGKEDESSIQGSGGTDSAKAGTAYSQSRGAYCVCGGGYMILGLVRQRMIKQIGESQESQLDAYLS